MTLKSLKALLAATALGVGALAYSGPADADCRGCRWHKGWHRGAVVAPDYVAPRYQEPTYYRPSYFTPPYGYTLRVWTWPGYDGSGWPSGWPF